MNVIRNILKVLFKQNIVFKYVFKNIKNEPHVLAFSNNI